MNKIFGVFVKKCLFQGDRLSKQNNALKTKSLFLGFVLLLSSLLMQNSWAGDFCDSGIAGDAGGIIFRDDNGNGVFNAEPKLAGVVIGAYNSAGDLLKDSVTNGLGQWSMSDLPVNVDVQFQLISKPGALTAAPLGADNAGFIVSAKTQSCIEQNFALILASACSNLPLEYGNRIWLDQNGDGVQNAGEVGIDGVTVTLYDISNAQIAQKVTANGGIYIFSDADGLQPNTDYKIHLDNAADYTDGNPLFEMSLTQGFQGTNPELDSDAQMVNTTPEITLTTGAAGLSVHRYDIGFTPPATIGALVWLDVNGNHEQDTYDESYTQKFQDLNDSWKGLIDLNSLMPETITNIPEPGLSGVKVSLYGAGPDAIAGTADDVFIRDTVTDDNGYYVFRPVDPNVPYRAVIDSSTLPNGVIPSYDEDGAGDHSIIVEALNPSEQHLTANYGYRGDVDLGVVKTPDQPYWDQSETNSWEINITNHGSTAAPHVVVADVLGDIVQSVATKGGPGPALYGSDVVFSRALLMAWKADEKGLFKNSPDYMDTADIDAIVSNWIDSNVSVSGADWSCSIGHKVNYPYGWDFSTPKYRTKLRDTLYHTTVYPYKDGTPFVPLIDINLYWLCELTSGDLVAGASAPPITFTINNKYNGWTHNLEHDWSAPESGQDGIIRTDLYGSRPGALGTYASPADQLNTVVTGSSYGEELLDDNPNENTAVIIANGDLEWSKQVLSGNPMDIGTPVEFEVTVTNNGSQPYYRPIFLYDLYSGKGNIVESSINMTINGALWSCYLLSKRVFECAHPAIAGGLAVGDSISLSYSISVAGIETTTTSYGNPKNTLRSAYSSMSDDDEGNNRIPVPLSYITTSFSVAKGAATQIDGQLEWTVHVGGTSIPAGQVLVIQEQLPAALLSVTNNGWQCEAHPKASEGGSYEHWQMCWIDPSTVNPVPNLIIRTEFIDGAVNTACPARGFRLGVQDWDFGANDQVCKMSPSYSGVPIVPTDLAITKSHAGGPWDREGDYTYTLTISEQGVGPDRPVVTEQPAPGQTITGMLNASGQALYDGNGDPIAGTGWSCNANYADNPATVPDESQRVVCIRDAVLSNSSDTLTVQVHIETSAGGIVHNDAWVKGLTRAEPTKTASTLNTCEQAGASYPPGVCDNDTEDDVAITTPDLQIEKTHVDPIIAGVPFDFTINVANNDDFSAIPAGNPIPFAGPLPLPVTVTDNYPDGLEYSGFSGVGWACVSDGAVPPIISCDYDDADHQLLAGESAPPLLLHSLAPHTSIVQMTNSAAVTTAISPIIMYSGTPDVVQDTFDILVPYIESNKDASLPQTLVADPATGTFDFTLNISNTKGTGAAAKPVKIIDTVPDAFTVNSISDNGQWDCSASSGQLVNCTYTGGTGVTADFPAGASSSVGVNVTTALSATEGKVKNTMVASHGGIQAINSVLTSWATVSVLRYAELSVNKIRDIASPLPNDTVSYSVTVTNTGISPAADVQVVDLLPYGTSYVDNAGSDAAWTCSSDGNTPEKVSCDLANSLIGSGAVAPNLNIRILISGEALPGISNFISVSTSTATTPNSTVVPYHVDDYVVQTGCIGDYVWWDKNEDGVEEGISVGADGIADTQDDSFGINGPGPDGTLGTGDDCSHAFQNTAMTLDWAGNDNQFGTADDFTNMLSTATDSKGYYNFDYLLPGEYRVNIDTASGTLVCDARSLGAFSATFDLDSGTTNADNTTLVSVGGGSSLIRKDVDFGYIDSSSCVINQPTLTTTCDDAGTAGDSTDDTFTYTINATGTSVGATYNISDGDTQTGLSYGSNHVSTNTFLITGGNLALTLTDVGAACSLANVAVTVPASCSTPPNQQADLAISKTVAPTSVVSGDTVIYTLVVSNNGPDAATGVVVSDVIPAGLIYNSNDGGAAYDAGTKMITWSVGNLALSATATLKITVTVD